MPFKLINENGIIHDFAHKMLWGHNIEDNSQKVIDFAGGCNTDQFNWDVFHYVPIKTGDFIIRNMQSGKIGLYEVIKSQKKRFDSPFGPDDCYEVVANWCGYYDRQTNQSIIWNNYGISKPLIEKILPKSESVEVTKKKSWLSKIIEKLT